MGSAEALFELRNGDKKVKFHLMFSDGAGDNNWAAHMIQDTIQKWEKPLKQFIRVI